jgi:alpha-beta hydrolase superfamily lysophospholipase
VVSDVDAAIAFYAKLGRDVTVDARRPDHAGCDLPNGTDPMLDTEPSGPRRRRAGNAARQAASLLAFQFPTPAEVDARSPN